MADDGSGPRTAALIERWKPRLGVPLGHVWHEHRGFPRRPKSATGRCCASRGGYCVFLDGDCLARPDFVAVHRALAEPGWFVSGNRALLSRALTEAVLREQLELRILDASAVAAAAAAAAALNRLAPVLRLPLGPLRKLRPRGLARRRAPAISRVWRVRPRTHRRLRCELQRLGAGGFRSGGAAAARRRAPQGRRVRHRRAAPVASRGRSLAAAAERRPARRSDCERPRARRARHVESRSRRCRCGGAAPAGSP